MTPLARCSHPHAWPAIECNENIELAGHEQWRDTAAGVFIVAVKALGVAYAVVIIGGVATVIIGVGWALIRAVTGH